MNPEEIKLKHPSICYNCRNARKPASDENQENGYVGCAYFAREQNEEKYPMSVIGNNTKEVAEGWVDLRARIFGEKSGIITNIQIITLEVKTCNAFEENYK